MENPKQGQQSGERSLEGDLARLRLQLELVREILSKQDTGSNLSELDENTEQVIGEIFGSPSEMMEAYSYAQLGEAGGLINLPEEAQGPGEQDTERLSLHQRERVLERCIAELEARRIHQEK